MEKNKKISFKNFEALTETGNGVLIGGFSMVTLGSSSSLTGSDVKNVRCVVGNNCQGGNCVKGCGTPSN